MAIQCSLIEFLESSYQGVNYTYLLKGQALGNFEYFASRNIFVSFLCNRQSFSTLFTEASANDFYANVRCALLHEARTKNGWRIKACNSSGAIADTTNRFVYRDHFQEGMLNYINQYGKDLQTSNTLQEAFVRKLDNLFA